MWQIYVTSNAQNCSENNNDTVVGLRLKMNRCARTIFTDIYHTGKYGTWTANKHYVKTHKIVVFVIKTSVIIIKLYIYSSTRNKLNYKHCR